MKHRILASFCALVMAVALFRLGQVPVTGQTATDTGAAAGAAAKTSWGEPDLQGIWSIDYQISLQRNPKYGNREFFTEEELAALDNQRAAMLRRDFRVQRGTERDVAGAYSSVFQTVKHTGRRTSLIVDPPDGRIPALTAEAAKRRDDMREYALALLQATQTCKNKEVACAGWKYGPPSPRRAEMPPVYNVGRINRNDGPEDQALSVRCMGGQLPDLQIGLAGLYRQIVQSPGHVQVFYDTGQGQGFTRGIPVSAAPHLPSSIRLWWGDSRARWEGNTLVVDVTNFSPKTDFQGSRENLHLTERWTRTGPGTLELATTIEDPTTWVRPWTVKQAWNRNSDKANRIYYEPRCAEGNYGLLGMLAGARAEDRAFAAGRGPNPALKDAATDFAVEENSDPLQ